MNTTRTMAQATVSHRLAARLRVEPFRLFNEPEAQINNGWLIFHSPDVAGEPDRCGGLPALKNHAREAAFGRKIPVLNLAEALPCTGA